METGLVRPEKLCRNGTRVEGKTNKPNSLYKSTSINQDRFSEGTSTILAQYPLNPPPMEPPLGQRQQSKLQEGLDYDEKDKYRVLILSISIKGKKYILFSKIYNDNYAKQYKIMI
jgi:hypothetical protein